MFHENVLNRINRWYRRTQRKCNKGKIFVFESP